MTAPNIIDLTANAPAYPSGGDPRRRMRLHHLLVKRRRWSNELDALLDVTDIDGYDATGLDLGWRAVG